MEDVFEMEDGCGHGQQTIATYPNREYHSVEPYFTEQILKVSFDQLWANLRKKKHFLTTWWDKNFPLDPFRTQREKKRGLWIKSH